MPAPSSSPPPTLEEPLAARLRGVTFAYERATQPALEEVDLTIGARDFLGVVGPNGGGKTTLLQLLLGLHRPSRGTIEVLGDPPQRARRRVGYVPQHARVDPTVPADVLDVVLLGRLDARSWGPRFGRADREAAFAALERTSSADLARRAFGSLSGGQRQRVLIARALAVDPALLLLDEPTTGIDIHREKELLSLLLRLNEDLPIVMVTHDLVLVTEHLERCAYVNRRVTATAAEDLSLARMEALYHGPPGAHASPRATPRADGVVEADAP
ncbi:MAG: ATP-binding cassette domain-containing protein [Acidobacteriota bacterium]